MLVYVDAGGRPRAQSFEPFLPGPLLGSSVASVRQLTLSMWIRDYPPCILRSFQHLAFVALETESEAGLALLWADDDTFHRCVFESS